MTPERQAEIEENLKCGYDSWRLNGPGHDVSIGPNHWTQLKNDMAELLEALREAKIREEETQETEPSRRWLNTVGKHPEGSAVQRILEVGAKIREEDA